MTSHITRDIDYENDPIVECPECGGHMYRDIYDGDCLYCGAHLPDGEPDPQIPLNFGD